MVWAECVSGNCENGTGTFADPDGWTYVGEFLDGKKHGKGTSTCGSECEPVEMVGAKYVGDFRDDKSHGEGTLTHPNGFKYVGEFRDDNLHGEGTLTFSNGFKYVGDIRDDNPHGEGTLTFSNGNKYVGEFVDGNIQGKGTLTWPNGDKYVGEFVDGNSHGEGTKTFADGTVKTGFWHHLEHFETKAEWDALVEKVRLTKEQAEQGDADAQYGLGSMYANQWRNNFPYNRAIPQDYVEAVKWYTLAAEQGYARAQAELGSMYENSWPYKGAIPQDYVEAVKWYTLAAEQGYADAQIELGYMYVKGHGVAVNYSKADLLFKDAMEDEEIRSLLNYTPWARLGIYTAENAFGYGLPLAALLILLHIFAKRWGWPAYLRFFTFLLCSGFIGLGLLSYMVLQGQLLSFFFIGSFVLMTLTSLGRQQWWAAITAATLAVGNIYAAMMGYY